MTETELSQSLLLPGTVLANPSANAMTARENSLNINDLIDPLVGVVL